MYEKYDYQQTSKLAKLREQVGLSQQQVAHFFGLRSRDSVSSWEIGESKPHQSRRADFIVYLLDTLRLRQDHQTFIEIWQHVLHGEWGWKLLSKQELQTYTKHVPYQTDEMLTADDFLAQTQSDAVFMMPPLPNHPLIGRESALKRIKQALLNQQRAIALCGLPGVGKTTLANMIAHDTEILAHFKDGILWGGLGQKPDLASLLSQWGQALGLQQEQLQQADSDVSALAKMVKQAIGPRAMLLIIDDVWQIESALAMQVMGLHCACLLTTRLPELAVTATDHQPIWISEFSEPEGALLLKNLTMTLPDNKPVSFLAPEEIKQLVTLVGGLPLGLVLIGNSLYKTVTQPRRFRETLARIKEEAGHYLHLSRPLSPSFAHPSIPHHKQISLASIIEVSYSYLDKQAQKALHALTRLPAKPARFSEETIIETIHMPITIVDHLYDQGLLQSVEGNAYTLHKTIHDFVQYQKL